MYVCYKADRLSSTKEVVSFMKIFFFFPVVGGGISTGPCSG